jgi:hypothetical protein
MPIDIRELYGDADSCRVRWGFPDTLFDWLALHQMKKLRA